MNNEPIERNAPATDRDEESIMDKLGDATEEVIDKVEDAKLSFVESVKANQTSRLIAAGFCVFFILLAAVWILRVT